ncbi:MAG: phage tail tape measure protein, partial [Bacillaceae bacterium G1]
VADTVAAALNTFGLEAAEAARVADILAMTANKSAAGIQDMQYAFKYAAPVANSLGMSIEELSAAIGIMANAGIRGEQAGTTMRAALLQLIDPSDEAAKMLDQLGIAITDAQGNFRPFRDIIADLKNAMSGMSNAQKDAFLATLFGREAVSGMLAVIEAGPEALNEFTTALENSTGASAEAAAKMKDNLQGALEELGGSIETAQIAIGSALSPAIRQIAEFIQTLVDAFNSLPEGAKQFIAFGTAITGAIMLLVAAFGGLLIIIGSVMSAIGTITAAFGGASAAITGLLGAIGLVAAAIAGLVAVGALVIANWETIRDTAAQVWGQISQVIGPAVEEVVSFVVEQFDGLAEWWRQIWPDLRQAFENIWNGIVAFLRPIINTIVQLMQWAWPLIQAVVAETWENVKNVISSALNIIMGLVNAFAALFTGNWSMLWEAIKQILSNALNLLWNLFQLWGTGKILKFVGYLGGQLGRIFRTIWDEVYGIFKSMLDKVFSVVKSVFDNILSWITGLGTKFFNAGKGLIEQIKKGIEAAVDTVVDSVKKLAQKIRDFLPFSPAKTGPLSDLDKLDFGGPIATSIQRAIPRVQGLLNELLTLPDNRLDVNITGGVQSSGPIVINMEGLLAGANINIRSDDDIRQLAREIWSMAQQAQRGLG